MQTALIGLYASLIEFIRRRLKASQTERASKRQTFRLCEDILTSKTLMLTRCQGTKDCSVISTK